MKEFFAKTGNHKLRFKPAFNPYTEPSMEVFSWHEGLGKWIEIANVSHSGCGEGPTARAAVTSLPPSVLLIPFLL